MHKSVQSEILRLGVPSIVPTGPDCVDETEWFNVAGGLLPEAKTRELMKHAAQCGHCGPLLKNAAETLSDEVTPSEETLLASLRSTRLEWQKNMAATLRGDLRKRRQKTSWWRAVLAWPTPAYAFAGIAAVAIVAWIGLRILHPPSAEQLLAQAYSERRTMEVRIPGAKYAPMQAERGTQRSDFDKPQPLLKAEFLIAENLGKNPNDPVWLQARARADLLNGNYDSAIKSLQRALETQPNSPGLLTDLGSAYFVRAKATERPIDYGYAINSLGRALAKSPDDPIALFNRALACEQMFLYAQAMDDWEHYLRIDRQGAWAEEARKRLATIQEKFNKRQQSEADPLLTPSEIANDIQDSALQDRIDARIEEYLHVALTEWLLQAFPASPVEPSKDSRVALATLAEITLRKHDDSWLTDLLGHTAGLQFSSGLQALSASVAADDRGDYSSANNFAQHAVQLLRTAASPAGELRARAEEVYSDHLLWEGQRCILLLRSLEEPLSSNSYGWLQGQMSLEKSNCASIVGDLGTYEKAIGAGIREAQTHHYTSLFLRGLGFQALSAASI